MKTQVKTEVCPKCGIDFPSLAHHQWTCDGSWPTGKKLSNINLHRRRLGLPEIPKERPTAATSGIGILPPDFQRIQRIAQDVAEETNHFPVNYCPQCGCNLGDLKARLNGAAVKHKRR